MDLKGAGQFGKFNSEPKARLGHSTILAIFYLGSGALMLLLPYFILL